MPEKLLKLALDTFFAVGDERKFRAAQKTFTGWYKKASSADQGEYHHLWCDWLKTNHE